MQVPKSAVQCELTAARTQNFPSASHVLRVTIYDNSAPTDTQIEESLEDNHCPSLCVSIGFSKKIAPVRPSDCGIADYHHGKDWIHANETPWQIPT